MKTLLKSYLVAGIIVTAIVVGSLVVYAAPTVNILGSRVVVGTGLFATTSANAHFTASGTIAFPSLYTVSQPFVTIESDGTLTTTSTPSGSSGISSLNGSTSSTQTFATGTATGIGLTIGTSNGIHTFTPTITSGYAIPLSASTTNWQSAYSIVNASSSLWEGFYQTPSSRITAGNNLYWSGNTLNGTTTPTFTSASIGTLTISSLATSPLVVGGTATTTIYGDGTTSIFGGGLTVAGKTVRGEYTIGASVINTTTSVPFSKEVPRASTITNFYCSTNGTSITFGADERASSTPNTHGTNVFSPVTCDSDGFTTTTFTNAGIAAGNLMTFYATSTLGNSTTTLNFNFTLTND